MRASVSQDERTPAEEDTLVYVAFLRALSPRVQGLQSGEALDDLAAALSMKDERLADEVRGIDMSGWTETSDLELAHTRLFTFGKVPPYETTYLKPNVVGHAGELADIAGFYRAFGFEVSKERPDHLLVELEFAAFLAAKEVAAVVEQNDEAVEVVRSARCSFYKSHFGCWVGAYAAKLAATEGDVPYTKLVDVLASWIALDCRHHGVMPLRPLETPSSGVFDGIDTDDNPLECMGCPSEYLHAGEDV
jgi:TorA maturation chaperone TorD